MTDKEYFAVTFGLLFLAHFYWCYRIAYPLIIDTSIKKGKSWLYLPLTWKGFYKRTVKIINPLFNLLVIGLGIFTLWLYFLPISLPFFLGIGLIFLIIQLGLSTFLSRQLMKKQEDSYFLIRSQLHEKFNSSGKSISESEIYNLASFQHQNLLLEADKKGYLIKTLDQQCKTAKIRKSKSKKISDS